MQNFPHEVCQLVSLHALNTFYRGIYMQESVADSRFPRGRSAKIMLH